MSLDAEGRLKTVRSGNHRAAFLLLSLAAMNLPQTAVLCLGGDGHVAIEPAGHDHCADGSHVHEYGPGGVKIHNHSHVGRPHCRSCVDIPVSVGTSDNRRARQELKWVPVQILDFQPGMDVSNPQDVPGIAELASSPALALLRHILALRHPPSVTSRNRESVDLCEGERRPFSIRRS